MDHVLIMRRLGEEQTEFAWGEDVSSLMRAAGHLMNDRLCVVAIIVDTRAQHRSGLHPRGLPVWGAFRRDDGTWSFPRVRS